ncbi:MAG: acyltransferase [Peptococcaceae bacterium]
MSNSYYSEEELKQIGFKKIGDNIKISRKTSIYSPESIEMGSNIRIDDFCILSGSIKLGSYIHIASHVALYGRLIIEMSDYTSISGRTLVYSTTDDYSGEFMTNPTIPSLYRNVIGGKVLFKKHVIIGAGCIVLPNVVVNEGAAIGAMSLVNKDIEAWSISAGIPCKKIKNRKRNILELEKALQENNQ